MTCTDAGRHAEAVAYLRRCLARSGTASHVRKAYAYLVCCHKELGQLREAWEACERGLRVFPLDAELRFRRADLLHALGRLPEAVEAYHDVLERHEPAHYTSVVEGVSGHLARHNLALVYEDLGDLAKAAEQWHRIAEEVPDYRPAQLALERLGQARGFGPAIQPP
jgi:tetratricopeptide (TPR) repeat protein